MASRWARGLYGHGGVTVRHHGHVTYFISERATRLPTKFTTKYLTMSDGIILGTLYSRVLSVIYLFYIIFR